MKDGNPFRKGIRFVSPFCYNWKGAFIRWYLLKKKLFFFFQGHKETQATLIAHLFLFVEYKYEYSLMSQPHLVFNNAKHS